MAWRIADNVVRGEIDNRVEGRVFGKIWLLGNADPVVLDLHGNCLRDVAGSKIEFTVSSKEKARELDGFSNIQKGAVGDITASRRVKTLDMPIEEAYAKKKQGIAIPAKTANCLYIEWFSQANGRVVIETVDFELTDMSDKTWHMSREEEVAQVQQNLDSIKDYIARMGQIRDELWQESVEKEAYKPMNEFEWERGLKESDAMVDKYGALLDKYMDHPDRERIIAREMGWTWLEDALDAEARGVFDEETDMPGQDLETYEDPEPDPLKEGIDWIRGEDGRLVHPLADRAFKSAMEMWHYCKDKDLLSENPDSDLHDMLFNAQTLSVKLAGALNGLARDSDPEAGFIVAYLKRALKYFHTSIAAAEKVEKKNLLELEKLVTFRQELFEIREEMLSLMSRFRNP